MCNKRLIKCLAIGTVIALTITIIGISLINLYDANWEDNIPIPCKFVQDNFFQEHRLQFGQKLYRILTFQPLYSDPQGGDNKLPFFWGLTLVLTLYSASSLWLDQGHRRLRAQIDGINPAPLNNSPRPVYI